jgi:hypothetical protein
MGAPVHRGVVLHIELTLGIEHPQRFLGGRAGVEVDERLGSPHPPAQDGEVGADRVHIEPLRVHMGHAVLPSVNRYGDTVPSTST